MATWQIIFVPIGLIIVGIIRQMLILREKHTQLGLAQEFLDRFNEWFNSNGREHESYNWMTEQSEIVQEMLGGSGVIEYSDRDRGILASNWPIILNALPDINFTFGDCGYNRLEQLQLRNLLLSQYVNNSFRRFIGLTKEQIRHERNRLFNPLSLLCGGVAWLIELPLLILNETNVITANRRAIIVNSRPFSLVSGIVALAGFASIIINIVTGWEPFMQTVTKWLK